MPTTRARAILGGCAVIGAIIGAVAGAGKGAAIGAAAGAGAGAVGQTVTRGRNVKLPAESLISYRFDRALNVAERTKALQETDITITAVFVIAGHAAAPCRPAS